MSLRHIFSTAPYERPYTLSERSDLLNQEKMFHRLVKGLNLCTCGQSFPDSTSKNIRWRFEHHVDTAVKVLADRIDGVES